jgi:hypothetical protein
LQQWSLSVSDLDSQKVNWGGVAWNECGDGRNKSPLGFALT